MLYVVGIGPGNINYFTKEAISVLESVNLIVCYKGYKEYIEQFNKEIYTSTMTKEIDRVEYALKESKNKDVALVSSGDATIYGLASLTYELNKKNNYNVNIKVVSGLTSASLCSAILGAPLNHDFGVISFSNLLTPLETIENRLKCLLNGDFVIAIYNPLSKSRKEPFLNCFNIIYKYCKNKNLDLVVGIVKNAGRTNEEYKITKISEFMDNLDDYMNYIDMSTTIIVGNSNTKIINNKIITPRGYISKYLK